MRLPFGVNVSGDAVQRKTDEIYNPLPNVIGIANDIIIWGDKEDGSDHDAALACFLQVTRENGLRINFDKIQYKTTEVTFFGETYTTKGHKPASDKVQAITQMPTPTNVTELQTFLGMCQYLAKYSPRIAELSEPLRQLTCKGIPFVWGPEHDEAFSALKQEITTAPTLRYYDPSKPLTIQTDACTKGLGAALLQEGQPVYFASKSLTKAHQNYVAIELEMLAVCWALKKFHHYIYGHSFTLQMDQKPLVAILSKSPSDASHTLERLIHKTLPYDFNVEYIQGKCNVLADCLSRAAVADTIELPIVHVHYVTSSLNCSADKLQVLRESTKPDETLVLLKEIVTQGWPEKIKDLPPELQPYWTFQEAITVADGLLLKGNHIIIPDKDRPQILKQIHEGHLGIQKCLQRAKATVYWPRLYDELKDLVTNCAICLKYSASNRKDSTKIGPPLGQEIPTEPWKKLATDLFTYDQANYLLVVDYTTKFPVVCKLTDLTARVVTEHMKAILSEFGTPHLIVSDNGPCYAAQYFADAMAEWGVNHIKVSPHHHQANGLAEGYVRIVKQLLTKAKESGHDPHKAIAIYRTTPLSDKLPSPFQLLYGRRPQTDLPQYTKSDPNQITALRHKDKNEAKPEINLPVGTHVMFTTPPNKKWYPAVIEEYLGYRSYKIRAADNAQYVRTRYHLKPYVPNSVKTAPKVENNKTSDSANVHVSTCTKKAPVKLDL